MSAHHLLEHLAIGGGFNRYELELVSEESVRPYDRVNLARVLQGHRPESLTMRDEAWYIQQGVHLRLGERVVAIDRPAQRLCTEANASIPYDHLVIATGGAPFVPSIPGHDLDGVVAYRTLDDVQYIASVARPGGRVLIAGGGLLGLETARVLTKRGCQVEIIEIAPWLLPRQLDLEGAALLESEIRKLGITLVLRTRVTEIRRGALGLTARLSNGTTRSAEMVIVAAGIRPRDELARSCGLACHPSGGIEVDDRLRTSDSRISGIGECVRHRGQTYGFVSPCYGMAEVLASRLVGKRRRFKGAHASARLKVEEIDLVTVGESRSEGRETRVLSWVGNAQYRRIVTRGRRVVGAIAVGEVSEFPRLQEAVAQRTVLRAGHRQRFAREGRFWAPGSSRPVSEWPDSAVVCTCTGATCGTLRAARDSGVRTSAALSERTGAATVCGGCEPLLCEIAGEQAGARRRGAGARLGVAAGLALAVVGAGAFAGPVPMATSFETGPKLDVLWRDAGYKQVSGFLVLALCALSLVFSLRKRWPSFSWGSFGAWRFVHTALGVATILGVGIHTGFRMGANLNFVLMVTFVGVVVLGSLAALVTSLEHRLPGPYGSMLRRSWTTAHILLVWPVPVLLLFHVLAVYFY